MRRFQLYCAHLNFAPPSLSVSVFPPQGKGKAAAKGKKGGRGKAAAAEEEPLDDAGDIDDEGGDGAPAADNNEEDADGGWDWPALRENAVSLLTSVLAADLRRMWPLGLPEEDFVNVFVKTGSRMLASPAAMKDKGTRAATVELLGVAAARFPSVITSACVSLVAMLVSHEHAAAPAVDLVTLWATGPTPAAVAAAVAAGQVHASRAPLPTGCPAAAGETLRELARISGSGDSKDSGGLRRSAAFVMEVSERLPSLVLANVSVLLPFLDAEAYTLRSAIVTALGNIVGRVFNQQQLASAQAKAAAAVAAAGAAGGGLGEASAAAAARQAEASTLMSERTRDTLLGMMLERSLDVHALTRAAVLRAWVALVQVAAVPMDRLGAVTAMAVARLRDKGALVRKAAVQLLRALLECNPFGGVIRPDFFSAHRDSAEAWLASHAPAVLARLTGSAAAAAAASGGDAAGAKGAAKKGGKGAAASGKGAKAAGGRRAGLASVREEDEDEDDEEDDGIVELDVDEELLADSEKTMQAEADGVARPPSGTADVAVTPEVAAYVQHRALASAGLAFAQQLAGAVPGLEAMMGSKVGSDVMEAIRFLSRARLFGVPGAETGLARMLTLVWSSEASVREEVISTFDKLYILNEALEEGEEDSEAGGEGAAPAAAAAEPEAAAAAAARPKRGASGKAGAAPKKRAAAKGRGKKGGDDSEGEEDDDDDMDELPVSDDDDDVEEDDDDEDAGPRKKKKGAAAAPKRAPAAKKAAAAPKGGRGKGAGSTAAAKADAAKRASVDAKLVATNLVSLLSGASLAVRTSLEEVLAESVKRGLLPASVSDALWEMVAAGYQQHQAARLRTAKLLASVAKAAHEGNGAKLGEAQAAGLATATAQAGPVEGALIKARNAMAVLSMIGAATAKASSSSAAAPAAPAASCLDTPYALTKLAMVLSPAAIPGSPLGLGLLRAGQAALGLPGDKLDVLDLAVASGDYRLARHACAALQKLAGDSKKHPAAVAAAAAAAAAAASAADDGEDGGGKAKKAPSRARSAKGKASAGANEAPAAGSDDPEGDRARLITRIVSAAACMVRGDWDGGDVECSHYYAAAQQAIDAVFALAHRPAEVFAEVLRHMAAATFVVAGGGAPVIAPSVSRTRLSRLFFVLGHVAMKLLLAAESLGVRVKALRVKAAERGAAGGAPAPAAAAAPEPAAKGKKGKAAAPAPAAAGGAQGGIEDQLGLNAAEDEKEAEAVASIGERELVLAADTLGGLFAPLVGQVVTRQLSSASAQTASADGSAGGGDSLAQSALLALCKLMAISSELCEAHLQLLFTVLSAARSPPLRATIAIALGDLAFRFPNLIEPYTGYLYARLRDPDAGVRKNTLMVLSHLILNDMVKVKGQVGEIAVCLNDPDPRIADLTRLVSGSARSDACGDMTTCQADRSCYSPPPLTYTARRNPNLASPPPLPCSSSRSCRSAETTRSTTSCPTRSPASPASHGRQRAARLPQRATVPATSSWRAPRRSRPGPLTPVPSARPCASCWASSTRTSTRSRWRTSCCTGSRPRPTTTCTRGATWRMR